MFQIWEAHFRLGANDVIIKENTNAKKIYNASTISKRHRHRYEINQEYIPQFERNGLIFSADSDGGKRMEMLEIPLHKFYLGVQFHPEFNSIQNSTVDQDILRKYFQHSSKHHLRNNYSILEIS